MHHVLSYPFLYKIALPPCLDQWRLKLLVHQQEKLYRLFNSATLAYNCLQEETGLLQINLNPNPNLHHTYVTLVDKLGIQHRLCLENIPFALQKRTQSAFKQLKHSIEHKETLLAQHILKEIVSCLQKRSNKEIDDFDPSPKRNIGLLEGKALFIDIGGFVSKKEYISPSLHAEVRSLRSWLAKRSLELALYLDDLIEEPVQKESLSL